MKWLQQQKKVEVLSAASQQQARAMSHFRRQLVQQVRTRLQQPGTMVWAFAAGALYGTSHGKFQMGSFDPLRYVNTFVVLWSLLSKEQTGAE